MDVNRLKKLSGLYEAFVQDPGYEMTWIIDSLYEWNAQVQELKPKKRQEAYREMLEVFDQFRAEWLNSST